MNIDIIAIVVIVVLASLAWWVNGMLNKIPVLKTVIDVIIVVAAVLLLLQSLGLVGGSTSVSVG